MLCLQGDRSTLSVPVTSLILVCTFTFLLALLQTKKYRSDGYDWKTRRATSKTVREDRMKLRVGGYQVREQDRITRHDSAHRSRIQILSNLDEHKVSLSQLLSSKGLYKSRGLATPYSPSIDEMCSYSCTEFMCYFLVALYILQIAVTLRNRTESDA